MNNITRTKSNAEIVTGKILVKGQRPSGRVAASSQAVTLTAGGSNSTVTSTA